MRTTVTTFALATLATTLLAQAPASNSAAPAPASSFAAPPDLLKPPAEATTSANGLSSRTITPGEGTERPIATDVVTVHYTGWSADGKMFDSSHTRNAPSTFPLNRVMAGWRECVQLMTMGEKRRCWVPQDLAYRGQAGRPTGTVVFDIELIDWRPSPTIPPPDVKAPPAEAKRTPNGLAYKVLRAGKGVRNPSRYASVTVHYTGWTTDGKMFDSSVTRGTPISFRLDEVIKGWSEGVPLMVEGERTRFWIPESLAYGGSGDGPRGMLVFDIELIRIQ
jgi:FKBP-type peptidyl-prolyl cis-trans isomerase